MKTDFVTRDVGGKTIATQMTVPSPSGTMDPTRSPLPQGMADVLSACLTQEREGVHLYRVVAMRALHPQWRQRYLQFGHETRRHVDMYEKLIVRAGGDPMYVSPSARLVCFRGTKLLEAGLLSGSFDEATRQLADLESVMIAAQRCVDNWQLVAETARHAAPGALRDSLLTATTEALAAKELNLAWAKDTFRNAQLSLAYGRSPFPTAAAAS